MEIPDIFQYVGQTITNVTDIFVQSTVSHLISQLQTLILTGVTLYIVLTGYAISTGAIQVPFWTFTKQCIKIIIITFFALTTEGYVGSVLEALNGFETGLSQIMSFREDASQSPLSIYEILDQSLNQGFDLVQQCVRKASDEGWRIGSAISWLFAGFIIGASTIYIILLGGTTIIVAKFSLAVVFALGPLFIASLMFPVTARFFDSWFSQVMNYLMTIIIMATVMTFAIKTYNTFITYTDMFNNSEINPISAAFQVCAVSGVLGWLISQAGSMAAGLAGGLSMATMNIRQMAAPVSHTVAASKGAYNLLNPQTTKMDMQTGLPMTTSRANHLMAGNTLWNPAYRQHIKDNIGKNWGRATGGSVNS